MRDPTVPAGDPQRPARGTRALRAFARASAPRATTVRATPVRATPVRATSVRATSVRANLVRAAVAPAAVVVLVLGVVAAAGNHRWHGTALTRSSPLVARPLAQVGAQHTAAPRAALAVQQPFHLPSWVVGVVIALLVLAAALAVVLVVAALWPGVRALLTRRRTPAAEPAVVGTVDPGLAGLADRLRAGVDEAGAGLRDPARTSSDAVIACWLGLEEAAARTGTVRAAWQTPSEFTTTLLITHDADPAACGELLDLYQRARFGHEHLGPEDTTAAATALDRIGQTIGRSAVRSTPGTRAEPPERTAADAVPDSGASVVVAATSRAPVAATTPDPVAATSGAAARADAQDTR